MIITNPHNPLGQTLSRETLIGYCKFAEKHDLQLISDEIYAMSVYDNAREFRSIPIRLVGEKKLM